MKTHEGIIAALQALSVPAESVEIIKAAFADSERVDWMLPMIEGPDGVGDQRTIAVVHCMTNGHAGRGLIDAAMKTKL